MADVTDAADAVVAVISAAVYPNGTGQPSVGNCDIIAYQGWPNPQTLDGDLANGKAHISVFPRPGDKITSVMMGDTEWCEHDNNGTTGTSVREVERATKQMQISVWASTPALRTAIAKPLDLALRLATRMTLPDGSRAIMTYVNQSERDERQVVQLYRRDFFFDVNYAVVQSDAEFTILHTITNVTGSLNGIAPGPTVTRFNPAT